MGREIKPVVMPVTPDAQPVAKTGDSYASKLLKYVPAEIIALYVSCDGIIETAKDAAGLPFSPELLKWAVFLLLIPVTYLYLNRGLRVMHPSQLWLSTAAFIVWVFSIGGPFTALGWYHPILGALLLPLFTFIAPLLGDQPVMMAPDPATMSEPQPQSEPTLPLESMGQQVPA